MKIRNKAFTLAETLVVMGIIGVIAALTIPNLSQSTGNREKVTKVKKAYAQLSEAVGRATAIYGPTDTWFTSDTTDVAKATRFGQRVTEFMKISKDCKTGTGCFANGDLQDSNSKRYKVITADGTSMSFYLANSSAIPDVSDKEFPAIAINIDGIKNKFQFAKNYFGFYVDPDDYSTFRPVGYQYKDDPTTIMNSVKTTTISTYWILEYDNMDYLKTDADWKCPNGKVLNLTANPPITSCN